LTGDELYKSGPKHHPTQKPVSLLTFFINHYSLEGEKILDMTMGSGSTGVACKRTNREFIGIEKMKIWYNIAEERIKKE